MNINYWKVGETYPVRDIEHDNHCKLIGFIFNQCPINWKDKTSYRNRADQSIYMVLVGSSLLTKRKFYVLAQPMASHILCDIMNDEPACSYSYLQGLEYGESVEQLICMLKQNWVFTSKLTYSSKYQEGFRDPLQDKLEKFENK